MPSQPFTRPSHVYMLWPSPHGRDVIKVLRNFYDKRFQTACADVAGPQKTLTGDIDIAFRALGIIVSGSLLPSPRRAVTANERHIESLSR